MEDMQNVTAALNALGVKTCLACGKAGAKSLCTGCRSVSFCGAACQAQAWSGHKKECRRIKRERARVLEAAAADYAADEAMAADECRPDIPAGAECYMCLNQTAPGRLRGDLVRMCSCRGPHAGFVHIRCLVKNAEARGEYDDKAYNKALMMCGQCRQDFRGPVAVALMRAACLHLVDRAETDGCRQAALMNLGAALSNVRRLDEALVVQEEVLATMRRLYGPDRFQTIQAEESLASLLRDKGGAEDLQAALRTFERTYAWRRQHFRHDDEDTLTASGHLACALRDVGQNSRAARILRDAVATRLRVQGEAHYDTLDDTMLLVDILFKQKKFDEARQIVDRCRPIARRVLGPDHDVTRELAELDSELRDVTQQSAQLDSEPLKT